MISNPMAASGALPPLSLGSAAGTAPAGTAQDLQSFMSALIQELRQSGAAATPAAAGTGGSPSAAGQTAASPAVHHHGLHRGANGLDSLLAQLQGSGVNDGSGASAVASIANSASQGATGGALQASFQRLMQDLRLANGASGSLHTSA